MVKLFTLDMSKYTLYDRSNVMPITDLHFGHLIEKSCSNILSLLSRVALCFKLCECISIKRTLHCGQLTFLK